MFSSRSTLEIFPDELFLELFSYISPVELYNVWFGLNSRLNAILRSVRTSFDLFEKTSLTSNALKFFTRQIVYIRLRIDDEKFDFKEFSQLRSLNIDCSLTCEQLEMINPKNLPFLQRLTVSAHSPRTDWLSEQILLRNNQCEQSFTSTSIHWIRVYHLPRLPSILTKSPSKFAHIHSIIIDRVTMNDLDLLLHLLTSLRRLKLTLVPRTLERSKVSLKTNEKSFRTHSLIYLNITMNTFDKLDEFYPLLMRLSSLKSLYIACDSLAMIDFQQLALALHRHVPELQTFNCSFQQTYFEDMSQVRSLSPLFRRMKCKRVNLCGEWHYHCITTQSC